MQSPNHAVHALHEHRGAQSPAAPQHQIVEVLQANTGYFAEDVHLVEQFLEIHHPHLPGPFLTPRDLA